MELPLRIIISGYYGFRNAGDEAMLAGLVAGLRRASNVAQPLGPRSLGEVGSAVSQLDLVVLSGDPQHTEALHGVRAIGRFDMRALRQELQAANLFISGGGNLFQDATSARSCLYYPYVIRQAVKAHVPVVILGQGIGPLRRWWLRALVRRCLNRVQGVAVRDSESARDLERLGVRRPPVRIAADLSLATDLPDAAAVAQAWRDLGVSDPAPVLAVAPRVWRVRGPGEKLIAALAAAISQAVAGIVAQGEPAPPGDGNAPRDVGQAPSPVVRGAAAAAPTQPGALRHRSGQAAVPQVVVFPMQRPQDDEACEALVRAVGGVFVRADLSPGLLAGMLGSARVVVGMRLHALIFAVMGGAMPVAISYDPKVDAFMADLGLTSAANVAGLDEPRVASAIIEAWNAPDERRAALRAVINDRRQALADTFTWVVEMARSPGREPQL